MDRKLNKQIENCLVAIDMVHSLPPKAFVEDLREWTCGSAACLGGWVAQHPHFQKQGVEPTLDGRPERQGKMTWELAAELFGHEDLFECRDNFIWGDKEGFLPEKKLILRRLKIALERLTK